MVTIATAEANPLPYTNNLVKPKALLPDIDGLVILFAIKQDTFQKGSPDFGRAHNAGGGIRTHEPLRDEVLSNAENSLPRAVDQAGRPPQEPSESLGRDKKNQTPHETDLVG